MEKKSTRAVNNIFARLVAAGERLMTVIRKCEGMPNRELGKLRIRSMNSATSGSGRHYMER